MLKSQWRYLPLRITLTTHIISPIGSMPQYDPSKDYYKVLQIQKQATQIQIKKAYYEMAKKYHPDHNPSMEAKFKEINEAYEILSDQKTKKEYDSARLSGRSASSSGYTQSNYNGYGSQYQNPYRANSYNNEQQRYREWWQKQWQEQIRRQQQQQQQYQQQQQQQYQQQQYQQYRNRNYQNYNYNYNNTNKNNQQYEDPNEIYRRYRQQYERLRNQQRNRYQQNFSRAQQQYQQMERQYSRMVMLRFARKSFIYGLFFTLLFSLIGQNRNNQMPPEQYYIDELGNVRQRHPNRNHDDYVAVVTGQNNYSSRMY